MATIEEDYVSFEVAKLLKEKWFKFIGDKDELSKAYIHAYTKEGKEVWGCYSPDYYPCITINMAMKWLREVHHIVIGINVGNENKKDNKDYSNPDRWWYFWEWTNDRGVYKEELQPDALSNEYSTYEDACENAIKYCLENLI